jgi:hypothetical protein
VGHSKGSPKGKVYSHESYIKNTKRSQKNDIMLHPKLPEKQEAKPKTDRRKNNKNKG